MANKTERIAVRLSKKSRTKLERFAEKQKRKFSDQARIFIEDALDSKRGRE